MAAIQDFMHTISPRLAILLDYDGQEAPHTYFAKLRAINETARSLVPAQNPYNANANIGTEAEVYNWMQGDLIIPNAILDTGADDSLYTDNIPEYLGIKIDNKNVNKLTGAVGNSQSIGTSYNVPISIDSEKDSITVSEKEISVIPTKKDRNGKDISIMMLGTKWQHRVGWDPIVKGEFTAAHNGKTITILLSTRKESRNAFNTEKWHSPEGFKLPDSVTTEE
ncbi:3156_t:CDS:2, partial [Acaulospora colombiana]